jgi:hypothetical protein
MSKKKTPNKSYWNEKKKEQVRLDYNNFLSVEGKDNSPHMAHIFATRMIAGGHDYMGMKERDLILLLAGEPPHMYD